MEICKAVVEVVDEKRFISIHVRGEEIKIPMSDDQSNVVKNAFNKILIQLKGGVFQIELDEVKEDLFSQVGNEYLSQLNREILEVYTEMKDYDFIDDIAQAD